MAIIAVLLLFANVVCWTAPAVNAKFPPGDSPQSFADSSKVNEAAFLKAHPAAHWNRVNGSDPSTYYGATYNNVNNAGAHGFSEILYSYVSQTGNNGSAFAGLTANTPYYNMTGGVAMLIGRFIMIVPMMAVAGSLAAKKVVPASAGTFPTTGLLWVGLLIGVILIVGGLTYFPALALGPIVEHFSMNAGTLY